MAKELVNIRKQKERLMGSSAVMNSLQTKTAVRFPEHDARVLDGDACALCLPADRSISRYNGNRDGLCSNGVCVCVCGRFVVPLPLCAAHPSCRLSPQIMQAQNARMEKQDVLGTVRKFAEASDRMAVTDDMLDDMLAAAVRDCLTLPLPVSPTLTLSRLWRIHACVCGSLMMTPLQRMTS